MGAGGRICPHCRKYTANDEPRCIHCGASLGPAWAADALRAIGANGTPVTNLFAGLCIAAFTVEVVLAMTTAERPPGTADVAFFGMDIWTMLRMGALGTGFHEPWRWVASCFLHMGALHLFMNLIALFDYARVLEPELRPARFFVGLFTTGVLGFVASEWWYSGGLYVTAGASGAVFGVQGLLLGSLLGRRDPRFKDFLFRTLIYSTLFYFALGTNQAAHLGGLAVGIGLGFFFDRERRAHRQDRIFNALAGAGAVAVLASGVFAVRSVLATAGM